MKFWDEANGFIEGGIFLLVYILNRVTRLLTWRKMIKMPAMTRIFFPTFWKIDAV